jgi:hypothetical protein
MWRKDAGSPGERSQRPGAGPVPLTEAFSRGLPYHARDRKPVLAALAVLLILGGVLATTTLVMNADKRVSAIVVTAYIGAGQPFDPKAVREARVVEDGARYERWADRDRVFRTVAAVSLLPGTLVTTDMTTERSRELVPGKARVGLALKPGQVPGGMAPGQRVQVVLVPGGGGAAAGQEGRLLAEGALVDQVGTSGDRTGGEVTMIVDSAVAPMIAAYASSGHIAITELPGGR